jgi:hypothetical protein
MDQWSQFLEDEDEDQVEKTYSKSSIVFLLDCTKFETFMTLKHIIDYLKYSIVNMSDRIGIVLFGTEKLKNESNLKNIYVLLDLEEVDVTKFKDLEDMASKKAFDDKIGISKDSPIRDAFAQCVLLLKHAPKHSKKYIFMITHQENPYEFQVNERTSLIMKAIDLVHSSISLQIFGLGQDGNDFRFDAFYNQLKYFSFPGEEANFENVASSNQNELKRLFQARESSHRKAFNLIFHLDTIQVSVRGYHIFVEKGKPGYKALDPTSNQIIVSKPQYICERSGKVLKPEEMGQMYDFGGGKAVFSKTEVHRIKLSMQPGIKSLIRNEIVRIQEK